MTKKDIYTVSTLIFLMLIIYFPVFHAQYLYTDESSQLWFFNKNINFNTSVPQGRYITYKIFTWLFANITTSGQIIYARLFSLFGWILCLPAWYIILKKMVGAENKITVALSLIYLISMPAFTITVLWASCLEMFFASTMGLLSGYALFKGIKSNNNMIDVSASTMIVSFLLGTLSLFTYQNGFGCFFIPFFIAFVLDKKFCKKIYIGLIAGIMIYGIYFLLFKYNLKSNGLEPSNRSILSPGYLWKKLIFLLNNPMATAFHFTMLFTEHSWAGKLVCYILLLSWLILAYIFTLSIPVKDKIIFLAGVLAFFILIYLPLMIVKENYASNRTLLALNFSLFIISMLMIFMLIKNKRLQQIITGCLSVIFLVNAWYNINREFISPLSIEFAGLKQIISDKYSTAMDTIYYIRPSEFAFEEKYGITRSWDEFGVASTAKPWVPEPLFKQLIFEKINNRAIAGHITVKSWSGIGDFKKEHAIVSENILFIDGPKIIFAK